MLDEIIQYAKKLGAEFLRAIDLTENAVQLAKSMAEIGDSS